MITASHVDAAREAPRRLDVGHERAPSPTGQPLATSDLVWLSRSVEEARRGRGDWDEPLAWWLWDVLADARAARRHEDCADPSWMHPGHRRDPSIASGGRRLRGARRTPSGARPLAKG
jgi:hypothetical protein